MNIVNLLQMIDEGEGLRVEFKRHFSSHEKIARELIAFANTKGGFLILGVEDNGKITGVKSEKEEAELVKQTVNNYIEPIIDYKVHFISVEDKEIVVIEVPESELKPHRIQDYLPELDIRSSQVFIRINDKSVVTGKEMIKILQARYNRKALVNYEIGNNERLVFEFLDKNEMITVKDLAEKANISRRRASRTLIKLVRADLLNIHTKDNGEEYFTYDGN